MILSAFVWTVSLGSIIAVLSIFLAFCGLWFAGGPWKSAYESVKAENAELEKRVKKLEEALVEEQKKPDVTGISQVVAHLVGSSAAVTANVQKMTEVVSGLANEISDHRLDLDEHRKQDSALMQALTSTVQGLGVIVADLHRSQVAHEERAIDRHKKIIEDVAIRDIAARTRVTDNPEGETP